MTQAQPLQPDKQVQKNRVHCIINLHSGTASHSEGSRAQQSNRTIRAIKKSFPASTIAFTTDEKNSARQLAAAYMQDAQSVRDVQGEADDSGATSAAAANEKLANANPKTSANENLLLIVGGDGTIGQVVQGLFDGKEHASQHDGKEHDGKEHDGKEHASQYAGKDAGLKTPTHPSTSPPPPPPLPFPQLGIVNTGSAGDFARYLALPTELTACLDVIKNRKIREVDVGQIEAMDLQNQQREFYFVNVASVGLSALIAERVNQYKNKNPLSYFLASFRENITAKNVPLEIICHTKEGTSHTNRSVAMLVGICNGKYFGQGMQIAPYALAEDGLFDVTIFHHWNRLLAPLHLRRLYKGTIYRSREVQALRSNHLEIRVAQSASKTNRSDQVLVEADGELIGHLPIRVTNIPRALRICVS